MAVESAAIARVVPVVCTVMHDSGDFVHNAPDVDDVVLTNTNAWHNESMWC